MMHEEILRDYLRFWEHHDAEGAYRFLNKHFYVPALRFCMHWISDEEDAKELVYDVLMRVWQKGDHLRKIRNLKVYIFVAVRNAALNFLQQQKKIHTLSWDEVDIRLSPLEPDPAQLLISSEMIGRIQDAIDKLPLKCKMVFKLIREEGFRNKDVAEILHISVNTIDNHLALAMRKISEAIHLYTQENTESSIQKATTRKKPDKNAES
ncbi:RNA polymerase sigma-70 factor (ECF subfamily) [Thermoflavifilum aggregans]|uniref:RNA polymerase sigma-70 factor (ECF subfamily) n=2 Tax=Thermoflavifilum aggregans TaxID=454188 RepID=A0A2M9CUZ4_9BACT|nr:RNA polymerase sigma-70 factor (ECF subfamily) [Thermoflavifilum aggregans]